MAFQDRRLDGFKEAAHKARLVLLEPIMDVEVVTPAEYVGDVMGDLSSRRGKIGGMTQRATAQVVTATVPLSEMFGYSTTLRLDEPGPRVTRCSSRTIEEVPKSKADEIHQQGKGLTRWPRRSSSGPSPT